MNTRHVNLNQTEPVQLWLIGDRPRCLAEADTERVNFCPIHGPEPIIAECEGPLGHTSPHVDSELGFEWEVESPDLAVLN